MTWRSETPRRTDGTPQETTVSDSESTVAPLLEFRVLLVEDDEDDYHLTRAVLQSCDRTRFRLDWARTYDEGLAALRRGEHDVYLLDYRLGQGNGLDLIREAKASAIDRPCILLTGDGNPAIDRAAIHNGAADYLPKHDLDGERLDRVIRHAVQRADRNRLLRRRRKHLEEILDTSHEGVVLWDGDGRTIFANRSVEEIVGVSREDLSSTSWSHPVWDLKPANGSDTEPAHGHPFSRLQRTGKRVNEERYELSRGDRSDVTLLVSAAPLSLPENSEDGVVAFLTDITKELRLEREIRRRYRLEILGKFAGGIAHDFNNLLTIMKGHIELLGTTESITESGEASLSELGQAVRRANDLTTQLLAFSRSQNLAVQDVDVEEVVHGVESMLSRVLGDDVELVVTSSVESAWIRVDPGQLERVLLNLVINARQAMPDGGRIEIRLEPASLPSGEAEEEIPAVVISVEDDGCGMDPETIERAFDPFFTTKSEGEGTGLGLSTVHAVVDQCGGRVEIESDVGGGATIRTYWPRGRKRDPEPESSETDTLELEGSETILVVEDRRAIRSLVARSLRDRGYTVHECDHAEVALQKFEEHDGEIDLVISDVVMQDMSGASLAQRLKTRQPGLPVILSSGHVELEHDEDITDAFDRFLPKPFALADLHRSVRELLDHGAAR